MNTISEFRGHYRFLSNFHPCTILLGGVYYPTVEHAYQAAKTLDRVARLEIANLETPGQAKRKGRNVTLRADWEEIKLDVMRACIAQKFSREPLRSQLLATGDTPLVEGNHWGDTFWGVCKGKGQNNLGVILMQVRRDLASS